LQSIISCCKVTCVYPKFQNFIVVFCELLLFGKSLDTTNLSF